MNIGTDNKIIESKGEKLNMGTKLIELVKKSLVKLHGTDSCKRMANMPATDVLFSILRENIENIYSKYKGKLPDEQYEQFIEDIFQIYKEYKLSLDKVEEREYGKLYGDYAERVLTIIHKYGVKAD